MSRDIQSELKQLHEVNPNVGVVYNGKTALEWYTLYCQASGQLEALRKLERDRWTGWAKEVSIMRMRACPKCGNKRCPKADSERYKCTGSNEVNQIGELEASDEATESKMVPAPPDGEYESYREELSKAGKTYFDALLRPKKAADDEAETR